MDTRWKKFRIIAVGINVFLACASATAGFVSYAYSYGVGDLAWFFSDGLEKSASADKLFQYRGDIDIVAFLFFAAALIFVFGAAFCVGTRDEEGKMKYNGFDRIPTELKLIAGFFLCFPVAILTSGLDEIMMRSSVSHLVTNHLNPAEFKAFEDYIGSFDDSFFDNSYLFLFSVLGLLLTLAIAMVLVLSLAKQIKGKQFLRSFFCFNLLFKGIDYMKHSDKTEIIVLCVLIGGILISATMFGSLLILALVLIFVPKLLEQYKEIRKGVKEVRQGNLDYKIPVKSETDLGRLAEEINDISAASGLAVQNELKHQKMKTDLISNVSHDLKTPLTSMISYVDLLKREGLDSENAGNYLDIIDEKTKRLKTLTEELFEAAKASSGEMPVNLEIIEMDALLKQAIAECEERLKENELELICGEAPESTKVLADGQLLWRVIENLLVNVSKYALPKSRVYIDLSEREDSIVLAIKNISREKLNISVEELMERFTRGDDSRNTEGSGLGLSIARDLTKLIGGRFTLTIDGDLFKAEVLLKKGN